MIEAYGPVAVGMVVGWMLYFFVRLYKLFSPKTLVATLAALSGGPVLTALERLAGGQDPKLGLWYFLGVGIGFFLYALYAGVVTMLYVFGVIKGLPRFQLAVGCGAGISEDLDRVEKLMEFEDVVKQWHMGGIDKESFKALLGKLKFTRSEYFRIKRVSPNDFDLPADCLKRFEDEGYPLALPT